MIRTSFPRAVLVGVGILAASPFGAGPALADVRAGVDAWSRGDYAAAIAEWKQPAEQGDADAQFNLGQAYKLGRGVERDLARAEELFGKAAAQGHQQAAANFGLLLFERGDRAGAMPYIIAAAGQGDARAQYLLGLAYFNGENVPKDWVRAYALESLAQQAGLPQATSALAQMDQYIPLDQRQQSVALATKLAADAEATRARQVAALNLGSPITPAGPRPPASMSDEHAASATPIPRMPSIATAEHALSEASRAAGSHAPSSAGASYTRTATPAMTAIPKRVPTPPAPPSPPAAVPAATGGAAAAPAPAPARAAEGAWRVQLGAFGVPGNAEKLWNRVKNRPELSGHGKIARPTGRLTTLLAGGFASQAEAQAACKRLSAAGFECLVTK